MDIDQIPHKEKPATPSEVVQQESSDSVPENPSSRWIDINSALPNLALGSFYALNAFRGITLPFMDRHWLGTMMGIEFLVIHSFPFMMLIGSAHPLNEQGEKCRQAAFWGLFGLYVITAAKMGGLPAIITFASLTVATYLGYMLRRTSPDSVGQLSMRWVISFLVFMITAGTARMPESVCEWPDHGRVVYFGMAYFLVLGLLELSGFYHSPRVLSFMKKFREQWKRGSEN